MYPNSLKILILTWLFIVLQTVCPGAQLVIYDQTDMTGTGKLVESVFTVYSGNQIPGGLNNKVSSFYLSEGYMAVVADQSDGTGPGKVYIADDGDLAVNTLPAELDNSISFIRVVPWKYTLKKGKCGWTNDPSLGESWYYAWNKDVAWGQDPTPPYGEYVPMSWGKGGSDPGAIDDYLLMDQVTHLLGFNEPDHCDSQSGQWWNLCDVPTSVGYFENLQKAGLRLGSPAPHEEGAKTTTSWLSQFMDQAEAADIRVDFVAVHWYDWSSSPASTPNASANVIFDRFKKYLSKAYQLYRRPIWITEFNANPNRPRATQDAFLQLAMPYLETIGYVERYSYFQPVSGSGEFFDEQGQITSTGRIYRDHVSTPAYTPKTLPGPWQHQDVGDVAEEGDAIYANGTYTVCGTGADIYGTADEFQYVYQPVTGDGEIIARVNSIVQRNAWTKSGVMIRESLDAGSKHANMLISASNGASFQFRSATNGTSGSTTQAGIQVPYWVKLVRQGNTLTGYYSADGSSWTQLESQTIEMNETVYAGLAVCSHSDGVFCDTTFTDVSLSWNNPNIDVPPVVEFDQTGFRTWLDGPAVTITATVTDLEAIAGIDWEFTTVPAGYTGDPRLFLTDNTTDMTMPTADIAVPDDTRASGYYEIKLTATDDAGGDGPLTGSNTIWFSVHQSPCDAYKADNSGIFREDINGDCVVDLLDFAELCQVWLDDRNPGSPIIIRP